MKKLLEQKIAFVTGAARGMGKTMVLRFAAEGADVAINDLDENALQVLASEVKSLGVRALVLAGSVASEQDVSVMVEKALKEFGRIDILVNNAGILYPTRILDISYTEWLKVMDINVNGVFLLTSRILPGMVKQKYGRIVNMSSSAGRSVSTLGGAHYTASKAAVLGLTRAVAKEVGKYGVTCNAVCPGLIDTEMVRQNVDSDRLAAYENSFPVPRLGTPEEVADLVVFLSSDRSAYITGAAVDINGGDLML